MSSIFAQSSIPQKTDSTDYRSLSDLLNELEEKAPHLYREVPQDAELIQLRKPASDEIVDNYMFSELVFCSEIFSLDNRYPFGVKTLDELKRMYPEFHQEGSNLLTDGTNFIKFEGVKEFYEGTYLAITDFSFTTMEGRFANGIRDGMTPAEVIETTCGPVDLYIKFMWIDWMDYFQAHSVYWFPEHRLPGFRDVLFYNMMKSGAWNSRKGGYMEMVFEEGRLKVRMTRPNVWEDE